MSDSVRPHRQWPTRLPCPWDPPGKNTGVGCHFLLQCMKVKSESEAAQSRLTPINPMDGNLPGSSVHGTFQARVLEWVAIASPLPILVNGFSVVQAKNFGVYLSIPAPNLTPTPGLLPLTLHISSSCQSCQAHVFSLMASHFPLLPTGLGPTLSCLDYSNGPISIFLLIILK